MRKLIAGIFVLALMAAPATGARPMPGPTTYNTKPALIKLHPITEYRVHSYLDLHK